MLLRRKTTSQQPLGEGSRFGDDVLSEETARITRQRQNEKTAETQQTPREKKPHKAGESLLANPGARISFTTGAGLSVWAVAEAVGRGALNAIPNDAAFLLIFVGAPLAGLGLSLSMGYYGAKLWDKYMRGD